MSINREEWLKAVADCYPQGETDDSALTVAELATLLGKPTRTMRDILSKLLSSGKATEARKMTTARNGVRRIVPAYRLI